MVAALVTLGQVQPARGATAQEIEDAIVGRQPGRTVDPQRLVLARHEKKQTDTAGGDHGAQAVDQVVAVEVRDREMALVEDAHEAGRSAAWRHVEAAVGAVGTDQHEGRPLDDAAARIIEHRRLLRRDEVTRRPVQLGLPDPGRHRPAARQLEPVPRAGHRRPGDRPAAAGAGQLGAECAGLAGDFQGIAPG